MERRQSGFGNAHDGKTRWVGVGMDCDWHDWQSAQNKQSLTMNKNVEKRYIFELTITKID
ncbi:hypothetical protein EVC45_08905 [Paraburkholderia sp. UYCP14C]|nr:hypothetical protein EVC45_08905 [Paraburkholderia sp. UYCP14C]